MATTSMSGGPTTDALNGKLNLEQDRNRIIGRDENNIPRLLILANEGNFVMKISQRDIDVQTATNQQLVFNSDNKLFKIIAADSGKITAGGLGTSVYVDIAHSGGDNAAFFAFGTPPDTSQFWGPGYEQNFPVIYWVLTSGYYVYGSFMHGQITADNLRIAVTRGTSASAGGAGDWQYRYYIVQETAQA